MTEAEAVVSERRRISAIWLVPIVALVLGVWMLIHTLRSQGPEITIVFSSGEGIEADKTKIKFRAVDVGLVESVGLADDLESVVVTAQLDKAAAPLLREDTQFWVVRPRVGPGGVSGLGTLLSGGYIQLAPGTGEEGRREFEGMDAPPVTPAGTPGLQLREWWANRRARWASGIRSCTRASASAGSRAPSSMSRARRCTTAHSSRRPTTTWSPRPHGSGTRAGSP